MPHSRAGNRQINETSLAREPRCAQRDLMIRRIRQRRISYIKLTWAAIGLLLFSLPLGPAPAADPVLTVEQEAVLARGNAIIDVKAGPYSGSASISAIIDVPAAPAAVWTTMLDCARALKYVRGLIECRVLERSLGTEWDVREHRVSWNAMLPEVRSRFRSTYVLHKSIEFNRVDGDLDFLQGLWLLEPRRDGRTTRLRYAAVVGKKTIVPDLLMRAAIEHDLPRTLSALRDEVLRASSQVR